MSEQHFWYIDDEHRVRWAVRVSAGPAAGGLGGGSARIYFTSRDGQISTSYLLEKEEQELTRYELIELLGQARRESAGASTPEAARVAA